MARSSDVFDAFDAGQEWGEREGGQIRNARAYRQGGHAAVADAAGRAGDTEAMDAARLRTRQYVALKQSQRQFADETTQRAYERLETIRPYAVGAIRRARDLPVERRAEFLNLPHVRRYFEDWGIAPEQYDSAVEQIANPETSDQALTAYEGAFTQHQQPDWQVSEQTGDIYAIDPNTGQPQAGGQVPGAGLMRRGAEADVANTERSARAPYSVGVGVGGRAPSGYQWTVDGELEPIPGGPARHQYYPDTAMGAANFANRMAAANATLRSIEEQHADDPGFWNGVYSIGRVGLGGADVQRYRQALREYQNAVLRRESGAVVSPQEFQSALQQYAFLPNEEPGVRENKRAARQRSIDGFIAQSQGAYQEFFGGSEQVSPPIDTPPPQSPPRPPNMPADATFDPATGLWRRPRGAAPAPRLSPTNPGQR